MSATATLPSPVIASTTTLFATQPHPRCVASVVIPARNEESGLAATLDALRLQVDLNGDLLDADTYEVLLLLNNCTDESAVVAERYKRRFPHFHLLVAQTALPPDRAHVGTARRMLMDAACERMEQQPGDCCAVMSTDADTLVAPNWVACNLRALQLGAEVVGGVIHLLPQDHASLDEGTRRAYEADRRYQANVAHLEALLDPDPADPWPRHLQHFGASLACTCEVYRRSGGLPPVKPLEDVAFIDALRKVGAKLRHAPDVHIHTSARLDGRAEVGLSGQLRHWLRESEEGTPHLVETCEWLEHRFRSISTLRVLNDSEHADCSAFKEQWHPRIRDAHAQRFTTPRFLEVVDCNALIEDHFEAAPRHAPIAEVNARIEEAIRRLTHAPEHPHENADVAGVKHASTPAG